MNSEHIPGKTYYRCDVCNELIRIKEEDFARTLHELTSYRATIRIGTNQDDEGLKDVYLDLCDDCYVQIDGAIGVVIKQKGGSNAQWKRDS